MEPSSRDRSDVRAWRRLKRTWVITHLYARQGF